MTAEDFLEANHQLRVQQQTTREEEEDRADESEAEELNNLRQASILFESQEISGKRPQMTICRFLFMSRSNFNFGIQNYFHVPCNAIFLFSH